MSDYTEMHMPINNVAFTQGSSLRPGPSLASLEEIGVVPPPAFLPVSVLAVMGRLPGDPDQLVSTAMIFPIHDLANVMAGIEETVAGWAPEDRARFTAFVDQFRMGHRENLADPAEIIKDE